MEWVETTAKTMEEAKEAALDQLGVGADEAEFDMLEEPKPGLFGRTRGQARIRARVKPSPVRAKQERRRKPKGDKPRSQSAGGKKQADQAATATDVVQPGPYSDDALQQDDAAPTNQPKTRSRGTGRNGKTEEKKMSNEERPQSDVTPQEVGDAAVSFMNDLVGAFGGTGTAELTVDGIELDVQVHGDDLGLLVGPGGRTLNAVQDLVRVAAQRRLGDHETRLRIDVAGYRERRSAALAKFAAEVAGQVRESGNARSLEPMTSADRKVIHDALNDEDGVVSTSSGEDPYRRVVVEPA
jgi:spoIIIJ-associated protein